MALSTYSELQAAIADWLNRADLTAVIPDFITLAEAELRRSLRAKQIRARSTISLDTTGEYTLPAGVKEITSLYLNGTTVMGEIELTTPERVNLFRSQWGPSGIPFAAAVVNGTLLLAPVPDTTYTADIIWDAEVAPLSDAAPTNWLLTDYPDVYLYGALMHAAPYLKDDERLPIWREQFAGALDRLEKARDSAEYGANTPVIRRKSALGE